MRTASEATLLVNAALHYLGDVVGVRILPDYRPSPREPLPGDDGALTELGLATAQDLERIVADLIAQATPFSAQDRADLTALRDFGPEAAPRVAVKENLAVLTVTFPDLDFSASYRTVTDVLRLAVAKAGGDTSLAEPCRFPSFSRAQRRRLLGLLDAVGQVQDSRDSAEEMARRCERWKRLARHLRPGDYARRFPRAAALLHQVASGDAEAGFTSRLEEALARMPETARGGPRARQAVRLADGRSESPGESMSRVRMWEHRLPKPELQVSVRVGSELYILDFYWPDHGVAGEFDGRVKYRSASFGQDPEDVVWREKLREDALRASGLTVARWTWAQAWGDAGAQMLRRLSAAGVRPTGRRW
mgnify:CR=1 FL=1